MKQARIRIIIALMSTALLGIILVQVYWIQSTLNQKEKIFGYQVADALTRVSENVETHWIATMLKSHTDLIFSDSAFAVNGSMRINKTWVSDTLIQEAMQSEHINIAALTEPGASYSYPAPGALPNRPTMILEPVEMGTRVGQEGGNDEIISTILKEIDKQFQVSADKLDQVMQQMIVEMIMQGAQPGDKVDTAYLSQMLQLEFRNRGIETEFQYGVLLNGKTLISPAADEQKSTLLKTQHTASLFPNNIFFGKDLLMVQFPDQRTYLLQSIWVLLLGSLLFTSVIIFVFSYSIHIILRQKKLSDIKNDFINNMTHEFKTPLATISLAVDAINSPLVLQDEQRVKHYTGIIREENRRMNGQVEKVLQAALLDKHELNLKPEELDLHEVIEHAVDNVTLLVEEKQGRITKRLEADNALFTGDNVHLVNVIYNLLDNASKYSPETPDIVISTRNKGNHILISVQDHGMGMSADQQKMIFEKFYRVPTGNVHNIKGFGLGLTYVKTVVEAHGGIIEVKSAPGKGSTFTIQLPQN